MLGNNLISVSFTQEELDKIEKSLKAIEEIVRKKAVNLTPEERQQYGKINENTENWISKVKGYMLQKPEYIPFYINKEEFEKDMRARHHIMPLLNRINQLQESMDDTAKLLSADIYNTAIAYYRNIKLQTAQNIPDITTIHKDLSSQFPGRSSAVPEKPNE